MKLRFYIDEILSQIRAARSAPASGDIFNSPHHFLVHCAIIHKILFPSEHSTRKEEKFFATERENMLKEYFNSYQDISPAGTVVAFRDNFEHLDTRMDKYINKNRGIIDKNLVIGGNSGLKIQDTFRHYENGKLYFMGEEFDNEEATKWIDSIEKYIISNPI